jgi:hypothetical protein
MQAKDMENLRYSVRVNAILNIHTPNQKGKLNVNNVINFFILIILKLSVPKCNSVLKNVILKVGNYINDFISILCKYLLVKNVIRNLGVILVTKENSAQKNVD